MSFICIINPVPVLNIKDLLAKHNFIQLVVLDILVKNASLR